MNMSFPASQRRNAVPLDFLYTAAKTVRLAAAALVLITGTTAWSQPHQREFGPYVLRSSTASTVNLSGETAKAHGIERDPRRALLNVTIMKKSQGLDETLPAKVQVRARNLTGRERDIEMRETTAEGRVSYMGTYEFVPNEVLDFTITARPEGGNEALTMTFRDRMPAK